MTGENHGSADIRDVQIPNLLGLHARPAAEFVKVSSRFDSEVFVSNGDIEVNGKSIMGVMMLAAECGSMLRIRVEGPDRAQALAALVTLVESGFGEELADPDQLPQL